MAQAREYVTFGLAQRAEAHIKVRQPLVSASVPKLPNVFKEVIAEELNVQKVEWGKVVKVNTRITAELNRVGLIRDVIRYVQTVRKEAELRVDDRIQLALITQNAELEQAIQEYSENIKAETLALDLSLRNEELKGLKREVLIENRKLLIILCRSK